MYQQTQRQNQVENMKQEDESKLYMVKKQQIESRIEDLTTYFDISNKSKSPATYIRHIAKKVQKIKSRNMDRSKESIVL